MACYFRVWGTDFAVDDALRHVAVEAADIWRRGTQIRSIRDADFHEAEHTGCSVLLSKSDDLAEQVTSSIAFCKENQKKLETWKHRYKADQMDFDFGLTWDPGVAIRFAKLPPEFLRYASALDCWIEISYYNLE